MGEVDKDEDEARLLELAGELRRLLGQMRRKLREQGHVGDFTPSQMNAIASLEAGPATVTGLALTQGVRPQSMGAIVATLEAAGVVSGEPDPDDGRKTLWSLTDDARARFAEARSARSDWLARSIGRELDPQEQARLAEALALLARIVEP